MNVAGPDPKHHAVLKLEGNFFYPVCLDLLAWWSWGYNRQNF